VNGDIVMSATKKAKIAEIEESSETPSGKLKDND
jgi:hypothetical protein